MRFKKGSIVEVLRKNEVPSGSWRCAEIVCGNGHNYTVKYKMDPCVSDEVILEMVLRKSIRPLPPLVELSENCSPGDILEVFQNFSWKMATVCKALDGNDFVVRLVGFCHEFRVRKHDLRVRQSWHDGKWFVIGKNIGNWEGGKCSQRSSWNHNQYLSAWVKGADIKRNSYATDELYAVKEKMESTFFPSRTLKRGLPRCCSEVDMLAKRAYKYRVVEKDGSRQHLLVTKPPPLAEKVEKHNYTALNSRSTYFTHLDEERENLDVLIGRSCEISLSPTDDEDNITCSVGSCSINSDGFHKSRSYFSEGHTDADCNLSDAESVCYGDSVEGNCLSTQKEYAEEIRRLELHAYRSTLEALYACGPLSWEQETLLTNLRLTLNVSNDEHLLELRHLASTASAPFR